jgi:hypothetical protein
MEERRENVIFYHDLMQRWPGLGNVGIAKKIIDLFQNNEHFPQPYSLEKILRDQSGNEIVYAEPQKECQCSVQNLGDREISVWKDIRDVVFKILEVEQYETVHSDVTFQRVSVHDGAIEHFYIRVEDLRELSDYSPCMLVDYLRKYRDSLPLFCSLEEEEFSFTEDERELFYNGSREGAALMLEYLGIHSLDFEHHRATHGFPFGTSLPPKEKQLAEAQQRIASLEEQLAATRTEPPSTVNAALWEGSVQAAFTVWAEIVQGDKTDWKEQEFKEAIEKQGMGCHTKVLSTAWSLLPDTFKHGSGRPKKTPKTSNSLES